MRAPRSRSAIVILACIAFAIHRPHHATAQESAPVSGTPIDVDSLKIGDPVGALWRSAVLPGWGQAYNGQLYKTPIVVAALGGLIYLAIDNNNRFHTFNEAYLYGLNKDEVPNPFPEFEESYEMYAGASTSTLRSERDRYRRLRNLSIIGAVAVYGLNILDAYVNGQLIGFDVGEDLSASLGLQPVGRAFTVRVTF